MPALTLFAQAGYRFGHARAIRGVAQGAVADVALLDLLRGTRDGARRIVEQDLLLRRSHQAEQGARLRIVILVDPVVPMVGRAFDTQRRLAEVGLLGPFLFAVRFITQGAALVAVDTHLAVAVIAVERALRRVDGDMAVVDTEAVALRVAI